jgi:endothelin-converting enzyme/putative endopeptidase
MRDEAHIAAILKLAGIADSETKAARILSLEIRIAQSDAPDSDAADVFKQYNRWKRGNFGVKAPGIDWNAYFESAGVAGQSEFIVWQPSAVTGTSALVGESIVEVLVTRQAAVERLPQ